MKSVGRALVIQVWVYTCEHRHVCTHTRAWEQAQASAPGHTSLSSLFCDGRAGTWQTTFGFGGSFLSDSASRGR